MIQSRAALFHGTPREVELSQLPLPTLQAGETLARVLGCTLCGSDLHSYEGHRKVPVPTVLGHEIVGEIVAFGKNKSRLDIAGQPLRVGDRVTWAIVASCGECFYCLRGLAQKCLQSVKYGHEPLRPGRELLGGLAEHVLLVAGTSIIRLPNELPLEVACPASCATATVAAALASAGEVCERTVCVLGAGMLGLTAAAMCHARGASAVVCVDMHVDRRERAKAFGATHSVAPNELPAIAKEVSNGHGFDLVLEFTGATAAFENAWPLVRMGGRFVLVGAVFPGAPFSLPLEQMVRRNLTISGVHNYGPEHLIAAVEFLSQHHRHYPFAGLVEAWCPLTAVTEAFEQARNPQAIRIGIKP
ncbi:L-threonine 3-dehydrogenase [Anatilimnocola aggregata]|uniref:alcohol dehydrogenase n=1 Tax=Anatilimnocola aggregata TaxID=2528021 RepID=A0A517YCE5_9BACT|nr:zinc-binding dehydrogenase [Anatilimnocola aggregata]QDU27910.1 L-threonine 3-dehydrogenase [Anatilimnocola aggregata]